MAQKEFTIEVGKDRFAKDARIVHQPYGMDIYLDGVESEDLIALVTPEEIAKEVDLSEMLKALIKTHGLGEFIFELVEGNKTEDILNHVYEADDDAVRTWTYDTFAKDE